MLPRVKRYLLLCAAIIVCGSAEAQIKLISREKLDSVANPRTVEGAKMLFEGGATISFGTISEDAGKWEKVLEWRNGGEETLVVTRVTTTCSCLQAVADKGAVKRGGKSAIRLAYYPKGHPGKVEQRVFIYTNLSSSKPTAIVTLKGVVTPSADHSADYPYHRGELRLRRDTLHLMGDRSQTERIACLNSGNRAMRLVADSMLSSRGLTLCTEPEVLPAGGEGDLLVTYTPEKDAKRPLWLKLYIKGLALPLREREIYIKIESEEK